MSQCLVRMTLPGRPIVKKNTKRAFGSGRSKRFVYSPRYLEWAENALKHLSRDVSIALLDRPMEARFRFYFVNRHAEPDVSNLVEGPQDILKQAHIISDDKLIYRVVAEKFFGAEEPRTEVELWSYEVGA